MRSLLVRTVHAWVQGYLGQRGFHVARLRFPEDHSLDIVGVLAAVEMVPGRRFQVIQIGANDGLTDDPIRDKVIRYGWATLCVEPLPKPYQALVRNYADYPNVVCENSAVGKEDGSMDLFVVRERPGDPHGLDRLASSSREVILKHRRSIPDLEERIDRVTVPMLSFGSLLSKHKIDYVDLLQIDTEGYDFEVIKLAFDQGLRPPIISFESDHLSYQDKRSCSSFLASHGYAMVSNKGDTFAYLAQRLDRLEVTHEAVGLSRVP